MGKKINIPDGQTAQPDNLSFLNRMILALQSFGSEAEIYDFAAESIYQMLDGKAIITLADVDVQTQKWKLRLVKGIGSKYEKLRTLLGFDIKNFTGDINPRYAEALASSKFVELDIDLPEMLSGKISNRIGDTIRKLFSLEHIYCTGILHNKKHYANITIIQKSSCREINFPLVETFVHIVAVFIDKISAESSLKESEERLTLALKSGRQGLYDLNIQSGKTIVNEEYATMLGYDPVGFHETNKNWIERLHPDDRARVAKEYKDYISGKTGKYIVEFRQRTANNGWKWILSHGEIVEHDRDGKPVRMLGTHTDLTDIKNVEHELRKSKDQLQGLFDHMSSGFAYHKVVTNKHNKVVDYVFLDVNKSFERLIGLKAADVIGKRVTHVWPGTEDDPANWLEIYGEVAQSGKPHSFEIFSRSIGRWFHIDVYSPQKSYFATTFEDITQRKEAELALKESEEKYRHLFDNLQIGIYRTRLSDGKLILANQRMAELFGYDSIEQALQNFYTNEHYVEENARKEMLKMVHREGRFDKYEAALTNARGDIRWYQYSGVLNKEKGYIEGVATDITVRKKTEEILKQKAEIINSTTDGIITTDFEGNILSWNGGAERIYGYHADEAIGNNINLLYKKEDLKKLGSMIKILLKGEKIENFEVNLIHKSGREIPVLLSLTSLNDENGNVKELIGFSREITLLKEVQKELQERNDFVQNILDRLPIGIALNKFNEGTATYINKKFEEIYGWPKEELADIEKFFLKVYPDKKYREQIMQQVIADIESGEPDRMHWEDIQPTTKKGEKKHVNAVNIPILEQNTMVSTAMDVTELKKAEKDLQKHKEKLEELVRERTKELEVANKDLQEKNKELAHFNELFIGREFRINELKEKVKILEEKLKKNS
ncbi:MAG: PAS domain S-box protein [Bacteroidota bacterium]|nr:PAS domain S-box protein [Bacteroidota bacterium]